MRRLAALALAVLVAGCSQGDDPTPPDADPNGPPHSQAPTSTTTATSSPTPTYSSSPTSAPAPGVTLSAQHQEDEAMDATFPGLMVAGQLDVTGNVAHFEAAANNFGQRTYRVSAICVAPWSEGMAGPDGTTAQHREPMATCAAFGLRDFPPGESIAFSAEWNGTLWSDGSDAFGPAPDGTYHWTARFQVYEGGSGAEYDRTATLPLEFQVTVA